MLEVMSIADLNAEYEGRGYCVLPSVFSDEEITWFRAATMNNLDLMGQTRNVAHSYHLAGFHRFPALAALHSRIVSDKRINEFVSGCFDPDAYCAIGLSDITVNRSQQWHTDLLRGRYSEFLEGGLPWAEQGAGCIKALIYLQDGASLQVVPGSHLAPSPLDDGLLEGIAETQDAVRVKVRSGDVVMMDIRALHRGATSDEMSRPELIIAPKILYSTVFGPVGSAFAQAMQVGNAHRMADWDRRYLGRVPTSV